MTLSVDELRQRTVEAMAEGAKDASDATLALIVEGAAHAINRRHGAIRAAELLYRLADWYAAPWPEQEAVSAVRRDRGRAG